MEEIIRDIEISINDLRNNYPCYEGIELVNLIRDHKINRILGYSNKELETHMFQLFWVYYKDKKYGNECI